jgi:hypothetical protein
MTITNKLNDLLTHEKTDVSFAIELENLTVEQTAENNLKIRA